MADYKKDVGKYYHDLLLKQIIAYSEKGIKESKEYISAFSQYLYVGAEDYRYNPTYLSKKHKKFHEFLCSAKKKYYVMLGFQKNLRENDVVKEFFTRNSCDGSNIMIVLNDLFEAKLTEDIQLAENFSVAGAGCNSSNDYFTITYGTRRRSGSVNMAEDDLNTLLKSVLVITEETEDKE